MLLFSLGMPVMPVDTHIHRIALRLGLIGPRVGADAAHPLLTAITPPDRMLEAHLLLIEHGRRTCKARRPRCDRLRAARPVPLRRDRGQRAGQAMARRLAWRGAGRGVQPVTAHR